MKKYNLSLFVVFSFSFNFIFAQSNPIARDDTVVMAKSQTKIVNLLANDTDPDGDAIVFIRFTNYNYLSQRNNFEIEKVGDSSVRITTNYFYYGDFKLFYVIRKKYKMQYFDTAVLHLTIENKPATVVDYMDINNIRASIEPEGSLFWDRVTNVGEIPKGGGVNAIFSAALWIGGYDQDSNLRAAAQTYRQMEQFGYFPGPVADQYDSLHRSKYNRVWKIDRGMIANHNANWNKSGYKADDNILLWPGNGNTANGEAATLAPFVDLNSNGIYEPHLGEYPCIYGDQAIYFIYNDDGPHIATKADSMRLEIHGMAYAFKSTNFALNNTLFFRYKFINRSNDTFTDVYAGKWVDFDLGHPLDDYVGCDSLRSVFYAYNGRNNDSTFYGLNPPAVGVSFLSDQMSHFMYYQNDWSLSGNPSEGIHFYYYLTGRYKNGQKIRYGGNGFNSVWEDRPVNYMFPDMPDLPRPAWSEVSAGNTPGDRRGLGTIGPFSLNPGESKSMDMAYVWTRKDGYNHIQNVYALLLDVKILQDWFADNPPACYSANTSISEKQKQGRIVDFYPNPAGDNLFLRKSSNTFSDCVISILSMDGKLLHSEFMNTEAMTIDISTLPQGFYLLHIHHDEGVQTERLMKM